MIINTPSEMFELGKSLSKKYHNILLFGDLGAGKTLLTKGFASGLGIDENLVQSPTYAYLNSYNHKLLHVDMYRIENENDVREKGINDQMSNHDYIAIERPKFIDKLDIQKYAIIKITKNGDQRIVDITTN